MRLCDVHSDNFPPFVDQSGPFKFCLRFADAGSMSADRIGLFNPMRTGADFFSSKASFHDERKIFGCNEGNLLSSSLGFFGLGGKITSCTQLTEKKSAFCFQYFLVYSARHKRDHGPKVRMPFQRNSAAPRRERRCARHGNQANPRARWACGHASARPRMPTGTDTGFETGV